MAPAPATVKIPASAAEQLPPPRQLMLTVRRVPSTATLLAPNPTCCCACAACGASSEARTTAAAANFANGRECLLATGFVPRLKAAAASANLAGLSFFIIFRPCLLLRIPRFPTQPSRSCLQALRVLCSETVPGAGDYSTTPAAIAKPPPDGRFSASWDAAGAENGGTAGLCGAPGGVRVSCVIARRAEHPTQPCGAPRPLGPVAPRTPFVGRDSPPLHTLDLFLPCNGGFWPCRSAAMCLQ
ncbi:MAG: hypothetical protein OXU61_07755 [Gammaproteobacteria bacterium]|nr:hypothetical protein [Gammaproteobacteria bacterium]